MDVRTLPSQAPNQLNQSTDAAPETQRAAVLLQQHTNTANGSLDGSALVNSLRELAAQDQAQCAGMLCGIEQLMSEKGHAPLDHARFRDAVQNDPDLANALKDTGFYWTLRGLQYVGGATQVASGALLAASTCVQTLGAGCVVGGAIVFKGVDNMQAAFHDRTTLMESYLRERLGNPTAAIAINAALDIASGRIASPAAATTSQQLANHVYNGVGDAATAIGAGRNMAEARPASAD